MINALTIDVEDFHNIFARDWLEREGEPTEAVVRNTSSLLEIFSRYGVRGTFFVLGEVAARFPQLVRDIAARGHELGVHGHRHRLVFKLTPEEFRQEVSTAKAIIEDLVGHPVLGHRAPAFSIHRETPWAFQVLGDAGFRYDSSVCPIKGSRYGWPGFPIGIHTMVLADGQKLVEAPLSSVSILGRRFPACGGGYLRHFPFLYTRWAMRSIQKDRPAIVYLHPYEIELGSQSIDTSKLSLEAARRAERFLALQLRNRSSVEGKIIRLLEHYSFAPLSEVIEKKLPDSLR